MRRRISLQQEDRLWSLRCQGHTYASIARLTGVPMGSLHKALKRARRRHLPSDHPAYPQRRRGILSDIQIDEIRRRRLHGETYQHIGRDYGLSAAVIRCICLGLTYRQPEIDAFPFTASAYTPPANEADRAPAFSNRLLQPSHARL